MSIEISEKTRGLWYVQMPAMDWLGGINEEGPGKFVLTYRFRYYVDDKSFDSKDRKSWYKAEVGTLEKGIAAFRMISGKMREAGGETYELLRGEGTPKQFMDQLTALPFTSMRKFDSKEEAKAAGYDV